ncbi:LOW QUALITY PROTEIN: hypothetical protein MXB_3142 [Myxobolus squamalis]|nr:LOW QUALITY PROTEIN: hypothetical protein MXB_3142 [Myxobolus squamalis]
MFGIFYAFLLCILFASSYSLVHEYTDADFDTRMTGKRALVIPSCGHCVRLKPTYESVSNTPSIMASEVAIVKTVPGKAKKFALNTGSASEISSFITNLDLPVVFGFFKDAKSKLYLKLVSLVGSHKGKFAFGYSFSSEQAKQLGHKQDSVVIFRQSLYKSPLEESILVSNSEKDLPKFLSDNTHSIVELLTPNKDSQFPRPLVVVYLPLDPSLQKSSFRRFRNTIIKIAKAHKEITFAVSTRDLFRDLIDDIAPKAGDKDIHIVAFESEDQKYASIELGSLDEFKKFEAVLVKFVSDFQKGNVLQKFIKSEPIPESQEGNVVTVVAKNIDQVVLDSDKDVFIEFYAPWCGHCKKLTPKFEELATLLKDEEKLIICKMDATANEVEKRFTVEGFPTIFFLKAGDKANPIQYNGKRDVSTMFKWIKEQATHPIKYDGELPSSKDEL